MGRASNRLVGWARGGKPREYSYAEQQGELLQVKVKLSHLQTPPDAKRGIVKGFTRAARSRMLRFVARVAWPKLKNQVFITLTYPDSRSYCTYDDRAKQRYLFLRYLEEHLRREVATLWRVEWKPRKSGKRKGELVCHQHLMPFGVTFVDQALVRKWWRKILHVTGPLCTDIRRSDNATDTAEYMAKYAAKESSLGALDYAAYVNKPGKAWDCTRRPLVPVETLRTVPHLSDAQIEIAMDVAKEYLQAKWRGSFTVLSSDARKLLARILNMPLSQLA